jgi:hypothetical protein
MIPRIENRTGRRAGFIVMVISRYLSPKPYALRRPDARGCSFDWTQIWRTEWASGYVGGVHHAIYEAMGGISSGMGVATTDSVARAGGLGRGAGSGVRNEPNFVVRFSSGAADGSGSAARLAWRTLSCFRARAKLRLVWLMQRWARQRVSDLSVKALPTESEPVLPASFRSHFAIGSTQSFLVG